MVSSYGGFLGHGASPKSSSHFDGMFPNKNHPAMGVPPFMEPPWNWMSHLQRTKISLEIYVQFQGAKEPHIPSDFWMVSCFLTNLFGTSIPVSWRDASYTVIPCKKNTLSVGIRPVSSEDCGSQRSCRAVLCLPPSYQVGWNLKAPWPGDQCRDLGIYDIYIYVIG